MQYCKGSFKLGIAVRHSKSNERVLIRFPFPGKVYEPWLESKIANEVMVLKFLSEKTSIPIPQVYHWGLTKESPQQLGPFIIEELMEGEDLGDLLKAPIKDQADPIILDPHLTRQSSTLSMSRSLASCWNFPPGISANWFHL